MSKLKFDGQTHEIALVDADGDTVGTWVAYNNLDRRATIRHIANGTYSILDRIVPHYHVPSADGPYGLHGIVRINVARHPGIGVHSGRANASESPGPQHLTMGCIRTTDDAMSAIRDLMRNDPLTTIEVTNNDAVRASAPATQHPRK